MQPINNRATQTGFGLGLRSVHYNDFLSHPQPVDWLEIISDNFLVQGGKPLEMLDKIRRDYPMAMHGVAMSIGSSSGVNLIYLKKIKALSDRIEPLWISDHLCWTGNDPHFLHDLYPLPYTDEAAKHVVAQIRQAQNVLQRRLVLENVSSYIHYRQSCASEWQFLSYIAEEADCLLLVDVNNIYVSSINHGFDACHYLRGLPAQRVKQIHLAGHSHQGGHIIDTHDQPVAEAVWALYAHACQLLGPVATMIERDDHIPDLATLLAELSHARQIAQQHICNTTDSPSDQRSDRYAAMPSTAAEASALLPTGNALSTIQQQMIAYVLGPQPSQDGDTVAQIAALIQPPTAGTVYDRLAIYHNAYRARLSEVLAETFEKTWLYMGAELFDQHAHTFAMVHPPKERSLNHFGKDLPHYLACLYPNNPELSELAQLEFDLRSTFDGPNHPALTAEKVQSDQAQTWLTANNILHPSLLLRVSYTNVIALWRAMDANQDVPEAICNAESSTIVIWRKGLLPHFESIEKSEAAFLMCLSQGHSIDQACKFFTGTETTADPTHLAQWFQHWWEQGFLSDTI